MTLQRQPLSDVLLSSMVVTDVFNVNSGDGQTIDIQRDVTEGSRAIVESDGIYRAIQQSAHDTLGLAYSHDLVLSYELTQNTENPVSGRTIWNFGKNLSNEITATFSTYSPDMESTVVETSELAVKSSGIYNALKQISNDVKYNQDEFLTSVETLIRQYIIENNRQIKAKISDITALTAITDSSDLSDIVHATTETVKILNNLHIYLESIT